MNVNQGTVGSDPVILATAGYDHTVRFWQAHSGICTRTVQHQDSVSFSNLSKKKKKVQVVLFSVNRVDNTRVVAFKYVIK